MKPVFMAAAAATGLVFGILASPVLAGAEAPPVLEMAKLLEPAASPAASVAAPASAPVSVAVRPSAATPPPPRPVTLVVATKSEPSGRVFADGPDLVRRYLALRSDLATPAPYLHTDAWIGAHIGAQTGAKGGAQTGWRAGVQAGAEWECLTQALYFEARGERAEGLFAVAEVILNRVDSSRYPDTVCDVVNQGTGRKFACQFTYTCDGLPERVEEPAAWERAGTVARVMLKGAPRVLTDGALFYHASHVSPRWSLGKALTSTIGAHRFYR